MLSLISHLELEKSLLSLSQGQIQTLIHHMGDENFSNDWANELNKPYSRKKDRLISSLSRWYLAHQALPAQLNNLEKCIDLGTAKVNQFAFDLQQSSSLSKEETKNHQANLVELTKMMNELSAINKEAAAITQNINNTMQQQQETEEEQTKLEENHEAMKDLRDTMSTTQSTTSVINKISKLIPQFDQNVVYQTQPLTLKPSLVRKYHNPQQLNEEIEKIEARISKANQLSQEQKQTLERLFERFNFKIEQAQLLLSGLPVQYRIPMPTMSVTTFTPSAKELAKIIEELSNIKPQMNFGSAG